MADPAGLTLTVGGATFSGWSGITLEAAMDTLADGFSVTGALDPENTVMLKQLRPYAACTIKLDGELMLTGIIDKADFNERTDGATFSVMGRSKAGQLVDCDIDGDKYEFTGMKLSEIARLLAKPFGVDVVVGLDTVETRTVTKERLVEFTRQTSLSGSGTSGQATAQLTYRETVVENTLGEAKAKPGDKVFAFLNGLATRKKILLTSDERGRLVLRQPPGTGKAVAAIVAGTSPYVGGDSSFDGTNRFSKYKVLGQETGHASIVGVAVDDKVPLYRPTVDVSTNADGLNPDAAAVWNRTHAFTKAMVLNIEVSGWRNAEGMLWRKGDIVTLVAPRLRVEKETRFLVAGRTMKLAEGGRTTTLRLVPPSVYSGKPSGGFPWE